MPNTQTDAARWRTHPDYRLVAVLPLNGQIGNAYTVWIWHEGQTDERYPVCDHYGFNFAAPSTMHEALNYCLRNTGWAVRAHHATEEELT